MTFFLGRKEYVLINIITDIEVKAYSGLQNPSHASSRVHVTQPSLVHLHRHQMVDTFVARSSTFAAAVGVSTEQALALRVSARLLSLANVLNFSRQTNLDFLART